MWQYLIKSSGFSKPVPNFPSSSLRVSSLGTPSCPTSVRSRRLAFMVRASKWRDAD